MDKPKVTHMSFNVSNLFAQLCSIDKFDVYYDFEEEYLVDRIFKTSVKLIPVNNSVLHQLPLTAFDMSVLNAIRSFVGVDFGIKYDFFDRESRRTAQDFAWLFFEKKCRKQIMMILKKRLLIA